MSLLQIHDPSSAAKAIGIDLGTTNSVVAYVPPTGDPVVIRNCDNDALVPSVVHYGAQGEVFVGKRAVELANHFPQETIASVKRAMGRSMADVSQLAKTYRMASDSERVVRFLVGGEKTVSPVEVSAEILRELRNWAEDELGSIGGAVITVPAYFDDAQRQATKDAAKLADIEVLRLLNEPTAAALAYGLDQKVNGLFAVYDLGGGTFDVSVLHLDNGVFHVRSTGGDSALGGDDFDRVLADHLSAQLTAAPLDHPGFQRTFLTATRTIKHALTDQPAVEAAFDFQGIDYPVGVTRETFDKLIEPLVARTRKACLRALSDADVGQVDGVILVGGATRVPYVRQAVAQIFGVEPLTNVDPDLAVALGAAIQADLLTNAERQDDVLLLDVLPLSLGIDTMGGVVDRVIPRNTPIPAQARRTYTTYADNQTGFELHVVQGERELTQDCRSLAQFSLKGIPPMAAGLARLEVTFNVDENGLLHVEAKELTTGNRQSIDVKPSHGLTDDEIEAMLIASYDNLDADLQARKLAEESVEAERILLATRRAIEEDGDLLSSEERTAIDSAATALQKSVAEKSLSGVVTWSERLTKATHEFAGRRMDRSMKAALQGADLRKVEADTEHAKGIERAHESPFGAR